MLHPSYHRLSQPRLLIWEDLSSNITSKLCRKKLTSRWSHPLLSRCLMLRLSWGGLRRIGLWVGDRREPFPRPWFGVWHLCSWGECQNGWRFPRRIMIGGETQCWCNWSNISKVGGERRWRLGVGDSSSLCDIKRWISIKEDNIIKSCFFRFILIQNTKEYIKIWEVGEIFFKNSNYQVYVVQNYHAFCLFGMVLFVFLLHSFLTSNAPSKQ